MPRAAKKTVATPKKEKNRALTGLLALAAQGEIIKTVERDGAQLRITYRNGLVETFLFKLPWQAVLVVMTLKDLNTCIEQAPVIKVTKERKAQEPS